MEDPGADPQVNGNIIVKLDRQPVAQRLNPDVFASDRKFQVAGVGHHIILNGIGLRTLRVSPASQLTEVLGEFVVPQVNWNSLNRDKSDRS